MSRHIATMLLIAFALSISACEDVQFKGGRGAEEQYRSATTWLFVPAAMRIHPFTAIEYDPDSQTYVLDARIELLDRLGDMTKGVGNFRFELYRAPRAAGMATSEGTLDYSWDAPLLTLEENRQHFDAITRTYLFRLKMDRPPQPGSKLVLVTQFADPGDRRLSAQAQVSVAESAESNPR